MMANGKKARVREMMMQQQKIAKKFMATISMLLLSAVMLGVSTYAWQILSTAPEVRGVNTAVGANGYLEIALQSPASGGAVSRAEITSGRGDASRPVKQRNNTWGGVIDLSTGYGIEVLTLYPSHINVYQPTVSVDTSRYLSVPQFGSDGRITSLTDVSFLSYTEVGNDASFTEGRTYGVNILGTVGEEVSASETVTYHYRRSMIRDEAAGYLEEYRSDLRDRVITLLEEQQVGIFNIILRASQLISGSGQLSDGATWTDDNVATAKAIISGMRTIVRESEASLKWALLGQAIADDTTYPGDDQTAMAALGDLYRNFLTYPLTSDGGVSIRSIAEANGYDDLVDAIDSIIRSENQLNNAWVYINDPATVSNACLLIIDIQNTFLKNGSELEPNGTGTGNPATGTIHRIYEVVDPNVKLQGQPARGIYYNYVKKYYTDYMYFVGANPGPTTGLFSIMANVLGDYQATNKAYFKSSSPFEFRAENNASGTWKQWTMYIRATGKSGTGSSANEIGQNAVSRYNESANRGVLGTVYDDIMAYDPGNAMISFSIEKRDGSAYGYSVDFAFMSNVNGNLLLQQEAMDRLLGEVPADETAAAAATMGGGSNASFTLSGDLMGSNSDSAKDLIKNIFVVLTDTDTGAILGIVGADDTQVVLEQATAKMALYEPMISSSGILSRGPKRGSGVITTLTANRPTYVTAIVFLNGDTLAPGSLAATQTSSLYGTINLQFSSSADLVPMDLSIITSQD